MFRGNHPTVWTKKTLKVPRNSQRVIDEKYGQQLYITSLDGKVAQVYPFEEWERIEQKLAGPPPLILRRRSFLERSTTGAGKLDGWPGRLLMPQYCEMRRR